MNISRRWFIGGAASLGAFQGCRFIESPFGRSGVARLKFGVVSDIHIIAENTDRTGQGNTRTLKRTFKWFDAQGADGVIIAGCHPGDCHYTSGNYFARRRMALLFSMLDYLGIERERTRVEWVSAAEGAKFADTMNDFAGKVASLGENKRLEDLRCKK